MSQRKKTKENKQPKNIPVGDKTRGQDDSPNNTIFDRIIAKDVELSRMCSVCAGETSSYGFMRPVMKILEYSCHGIPWLFGTAIAIFMTHKAYLHEKQINLFIGNNNLIILGWAEADLGAINAFVFKCILNTF